MVREVRSGRRIWRFDGGRPVRETAHTLDDVRAVERMTGDRTRGLQEFSRRARGAPAKNVMRDLKYKDGRNVIGTRFNPYVVHSGEPFVSEGRRAPGAV